ncbi:MAG: hypothetical protein AAGA35_01730 [Patescibacteria group bacterium]
MWKTLDRLRQKPKEQKSRIALIGAGSVTALVALVWFVATAASFSNNTATQTAEVIEAAPAFSNMWKQAKEEFGDLWVGSEPTTTIQELPEPIREPLPDASDLELAPETIEQVTERSTSSVTVRTVLIGTTSQATTTGQ